jgi:hypothetical protein
MKKRVKEQLNKVEAIPPKEQIPALGFQNFLI